MQGIQNRNKKVVYCCRLLLLGIFCLSLMVARSQNLNNPNKVGPLGIRVNTLSGNVFIPRTDIFIPSKGMDLDLSFHYNSFLYTEDYGYGNGWTFQYNIKYSHDSSSPGGRLIMWGDGREDQYDSLPGGAYRAPKGFFSTLSQYQPGKYVLTELNGMKYIFDDAAHKRITRMEDANGNFINFIYTDSLLSEMNSGAGQAITFSYDVSGRLESITDANGSPVRVYNYSYDLAGNLKQVTNPLGGIYQFAYLVNGPMKSMTDRNNNKADIIYYPDFTARELIGCNKRLSFSYDSSSGITVATEHLETGNQVTKYRYETVNGYSWLKSVTGNCCGNNMSYEYDSLGNRVKIVDANGQTYRFTYDLFGNMLTSTDPLGNVSTYTYTSDFKKISSFRDAKGNQYNMTYDAKGNLTQLVAPEGKVYTATYSATGEIITSKDPNGNTYTYVYDAYGNPVSVSGPNGYSASLSFDARGRLLSYVDANGNASAAEYDILNRLRKITDPLNNTVQFNYDAEGNPVVITNENNESATLGYDASNRLVKLTGPTGHSSSFLYDGADNLLSIKDALGQEARFVYDQLNRMTSAEDPERNKMLFDYDGNGNITRVVLPNGRIMSYSYDQMNRVVSVQDEAGTMAEFGYDKNANVISYRNATGATQTSTYDSLNRIKSITDPLGNTTHFSYDKMNNIIAVTDREGHTSQYTYDSLNRVKTYTDNNGFVLSMGYDAQGNIVSVTDQNGNNTTYTYDQLNRRKRMTYPDGRYNEMNYDNKGNLVSIRQTDATVITYQYDTLNRITSRTMPDGEVYAFTYDKLGRLLSATNRSGTTTFTYDMLSRVTSETFDGRAIQYAYSLTGRKQTTIYPDGTELIKEFDTRNRLVKVSRNGSVLATYLYNPADQLIEKKLGNGVNTIMQYDFANRLSSFTTTASSGIIQNSKFTYDKENNKTAILRTDNPSLSEAFGYDDGYRLISYRRGPTGSPVVQQTYTYDAVGNRTSANLNGVTKTYSVNNLNQVTGVNAVNFTYDGRGNLTFDGLFYKTYDSENRLIKDSSSPASVITYGYDALQRRVLKTINGNALKYTYSGVAQIEERSAGGAVISKHMFTGLYAPLYHERNGNSFYYHSNELGTVEAMTGNTGRLVEKYVYDVYGKPSRFDSLNNPLASSITGNRFGFTGQEYDSATASYRFFFRNYSPETGVFNQRDLIEYQDGMGMYQYVRNNPANGVDVWGLDAIDDEYALPPGYKYDVMQMYGGKDPCYHDPNKIKLITNY